MRILLRFRPVALSLGLALAISLPFFYIEPGSAQFAGANSQCVNPTPGAFLAPGLVQIDVKPGNAQNNVALNEGVVHVAICGEDEDGTGPDAPTFEPAEDVWVVCPSNSSNRCKNRTPVAPPFDPPATITTPTFGVTGLEESLDSCCSVRDVNHDGVKDLVLGFRRSATQMTGAPNELLIVRGCCDTPEFQGANQVSCRVDCPSSAGPPDLQPCDVEGFCPPPGGE